MEKHSDWKAAKAKEACAEKLRLDQETETKQEEDKQQMTILKEQQETTEKKRLDDLVKEKKREMLGIDISREKECGDCSLNKGIFQYKYAVDGDTKSSYGNDQYKNQNKEKLEAAEKKHLRKERKKKKAKNNAAKVRTAKSNKRREVQKTIEAALANEEKRTDVDNKENYLNLQKKRSTNS
ncbi:hypothetical protein ARMSODRAFT_968154 [Armillaria solidipes]|uniref:Uncharacterized protein n=1 Tax=Armillaria solidipes TaxID=1076256 RepID=A0A2H3CRE3_9AGAR|nr:hypothetical protein ARMSODRAFT_968154 [Armillaria solidipes]